MSVTQDAPADTFVQFEGQWKFNGDVATFLGPDAATLEQAA